MDRDEGLVLGERKAGKAEENKLVCSAKLRKDQVPSKSADKTKGKATVCRTVSWERGGMLVRKVNLGVASTALSLVPKEDAITRRGRSDEGVGWRSSPPEEDAPARLEGTAARETK